MDIWRNCVISGMPNMQSIFANEVFGGGLEGLDGPAPGGLGSGTRFADENGVLGLTFGYLDPLQDFDIDIYPNPDDFNRTDIDSFDRNVYIAVTDVATDQVLSCCQVEQTTPQAWDSTLMTWGGEAEEIFDQD